MSAHSTKEYTIDIPNTVVYHNNPMRNSGNNKTNNNTNTLNFNKLRLSNIEKEILKNRNITLSNRKKMILNRRRRLNTIKNRKRVKSLMTYKTTHLESRI